MARSRRRCAAAAGSAPLRLGAGVKNAGEVVERRRGVGLRAREVIGMPSLTERGISRSEGMKTFGSLPSTATTSCWLIPTRVSARFRTSWIFFGS